MYFSPYPKGSLFIDIFTKRIQPQSAVPVPAPFFPEQGSVIVAVSSSLTGSSKSPTRLPVTSQAILVGATFGISFAAVFILNFVIYS
jgi:hypothetical protein